jgi:hypothetical protein
MDTTTLLIIGAIILLVIAFFMRNRVAPRGTYDDPNSRSSGSIGGGTRAYDDPNYNSGGSIGGGEGSGGRTYDSPDFNSSGTIGGETSHRKSSNERGRAQHRIPRCLIVGKCGVKASLSGTLRQSKSP